MRESLRFYTRIALGAGIVTMVMAVLAARATITEGRKSSEYQQQLLAEQVAARMHDLLETTRDQINDLNLRIGEPSIEKFLTDTMHRHADDGWIGINLIDADTGARTSVGLADHEHDGEGYVACPRCGANQRLVFVGLQTRHQVEVFLNLQQIREALFAPSRGVVFSGRVQLLGEEELLIDLAAATHQPVAQDFEARIEVEKYPGLHVLLIQPEGQLHAGVRHGVLLQLASMGGFAVVMAAAFSLLRRWRRREQDTRERAMKGRLQMQQRSAHLDRLATIGTLAASVAHELAGPLTYVFANIEFAHNISKKEKNEQVCELLADSLEGCSQVGTILNDMRTFAHPGQEHKDMVDLREVIASAGRIANARMRSVVELKLTLGALPRVRGNASRLGQVFLNLFVNAADALAGHERSDGEDPPGIEVKAKRNTESKMLVITVADNGPGVPAELHGRIFESFFTTKSADEGTGLGLAICREIVREHGGELLLDASTKQGARFLVELPLASTQRLPTSENNLSAAM